MYVHKRRRYIAGPGEEVGQEGVGPTVEGPGGNDVVPAADELEQDGGYGGHPGGRAVGGLGPFQGGHLTAEVEHRRIEVTAVDEEVPVGAELAGEHFAEGLWLHHGESGGCLDGHVDTAVLAKLMASAGKCGCRVFPGRGRS